MRHRKRSVKLGRKKEHRRGLLANLVCELIQHGMIVTTLAKARAARPLAERMVTLAKRGNAVSGAARVHAHRLAVARLRQKSAARKLFAEVAPKNNQRNGGYTRITKLGRRGSDAAEMAILEWVGASATPGPGAEAKDKKPQTAKS